MFSQADVTIQVHETENGSLINIFSVDVNFLKLLSENLNSITFVDEPNNFVGTPAITLACNKTQANKA